MSNGKPDNDATALRIKRSVDLLYQPFASIVTSAIAACKNAGLHIEIFETWRDPRRQDWLFEQGRTRPGAIVTRSQSWESWHQFGLAVDTAFFVDGKWSWDGPWPNVTEIMHHHGLKSLDFEKPHFQFDSPVSILAAKELTLRYGIQAFWTLLDGAK